MMILTIALIDFCDTFGFSYPKLNWNITRTEKKKKLSISSYVEGKRLRIVNDIIFFLSQLNIAFR